MLRNCIAEHTQSQYKRASTVKFTQEHLGTFLRVPLEIFLTLVYHGDEVSH